MRIAYLSAGTGSFHCGSCMRDNALVKEWIRVGHEALLVPMYLPMVLDEIPAPASGLFYGGVSVYLQQVSRLFRKSPRWLDRMLDSPRILASAAKRAASTSAADLGPITLSMLRGEEGNQRKELDRICQWLRTEFRPDVVFLSYALLIGAARSIKSATGARVFCTLQGEDTYLNAIPEPFRTRCWQEIAKRVIDVDGFVAVSHHHAQVMGGNSSIPAEKMHVIHNGIDLEGYPTAPRANPVDPPVIGFLARMHAAKGLPRFVDACVHALPRMQLGSKIWIGGSCSSSDDPLVREMQNQFTNAGIASGTILSGPGLDRIELAAKSPLTAVFLPNLTREEKVLFLQGLTVFSVPAEYGESFGLYVIESMAAGTPVVQPKCAAFPEILQCTGGGSLVPAGDSRALTEELVRVCKDPAAALQLGEQGRLAVRKQFSVQGMAQRILDLIAAASGAAH